MAENYQYNADTGVIVPDTAEVLETVQNEYKQALGEDLNLNPSTPQGRLIEAEAASRVQLLEATAIMANVINPEKSFGVYLDALCSLSGITRIAGSSSRVLASIQGVPGTVIAAGSRAKNTLGSVWYLENAVTIPATGVQTAYFLSEQLGPSDCPVGSLTSIMDAVLGWETITNNLPAQAGVLPESDEALRQRRKQNLYRGSALIPSIKARLNLVPNIRSAFVYENYNSQPVTYQGITINAHSIYAVADGGTDQDVAQALFETKSDGCGYTGNVTVNVKDSSWGIEYPVSFNRPVQVSVSVSVTVKIADNSGNTSDLEQAVKNAVLAYEQGEVEQVEGLKVGTDVSPFEIASAISIQIPDIFVSLVKVAKAGENPTMDLIPVNINQVATISADDITVTVVE